MMIIAETKPDYPNISIERINGKIVKLLTMNSLSKYVGLKSHTLRQWEKKGILPETPISKKFNSGLLGECDRRYYTLDHAKLLKKWVEKVKPNHGIQIKESMIDILHENWDKATKQFSIKLESQKDEEWYDDNL